MSERWKAAQRAGYSLTRRETHVGHAWDYTYPGKTAMEGHMFRTPQDAIHAALVRYTAEELRAEDIMRWRAERWPWFHVPTGTWLEENRYYAFGDDGVLHDCAGYETATQGMNIIAAGLDISELHGYFSDKPEALGSVCACILTGRQYVDQLYVITGGDAEQLAMHGHWSREAACPACDAGVCSVHGPEQRMAGVKAARFEVRVPLRGGITAEEVLHALGSACSEYTGGVMKPSRPSVADAINRAVVERK